MRHAQENRDNGFMEISTVKAERGITITVLLRKFPGKHTLVLSVRVQRGDRNCIVI